jgi:hypothetical protein
MESRRRRNPEEEQLAQVIQEQQQDHQQLQQGQQKPSSDLPAGTHRVPYPSGDGHMIIRNGFTNA